MVSEKLELAKALERVSQSLNAFIFKIGHRFGGDGSYYWIDEPTREEAQEAMAANNAARAALAQPPEQGGDRG